MSSVHSKGTPLFWGGFSGKPPVGGHTHVIRAGVQKNPPARAPKTRRGFPWFCAGPLRASVGYDASRLQRAGGGDEWWGFGIVFVFSLVLGWTPESGIHFAAAPPHPRKFNKLGLMTMESTQPSALLTFFWEGFPS